MIDYAAIRERLMPMLGSLLRDLFPSGITEGREFKIGSLRGEAGRSCSINTESGVWADFATGERGGDFVSLLQARTGLAMEDCAQVVLTLLDDPDAGRKALRYLLSGGPPRRPGDLSTAGPSPTYIPDHFLLGEWGAPSGIWEYRNAEGRLLFCVCRYGDATAKTYRPWTWDGDRWQPRAYREGRPLYGLAALLAHPERPVLVVEGEKCADRAATLLGEAMVCVTWAGGAQAVGQSVWLPLKGRHVTIWPDADGPGRDAAAAIARQLQGLAASVDVLDVSDLSHGADVADLTFAGADLLAWMAARRHPAAATTPAAPLLEANEWKRGLHYTESGSLRRTAHNALWLVAHDPWFLSSWWIETWDEAIYVDASPATDADLFRARVYLSHQWRLEIGAEMLIGALLAGLPRRNRIADWLTGLVWDGTSRFRTLATEGLRLNGTVGYAAEVLQLLLCGMVARALAPGCKYDACIILRGAQGIGKTRFYELLGGDRYVMLSAATTGDKDVYGAMARGWLVNIEELFDRRTPLRELKSLISSTTDTWRRPYDRAMSVQPKRCVFVGTTDADSEFLDDAAGYRRFFVIECGASAFDLAKVAELRDMLFAEAVARIRTVPAWYRLTAETLTAQVEAAADREVTDPWTDAVATYVEFRDSVTMTEVLGDGLCVATSLHNPPMTRRVHRLLLSLGFTKTRLRTGTDGARQCQYRRIAHDEPQIEPDSSEISPSS